MLTVDGFAVRAPVKPSYPNRNDTIIVFYFAANQKIETILKLLCLILMLNLRILYFIHITVD